MKYLLTSLILIVTLFSCSQSKNEKTEEEIPSVELKTETADSSIIKHFENENHTRKSTSTGTVSNGKLKNGAIIPFKGSNFSYFDTTSYLANRGFVNSVIKDVVLATYKEMENLYPNDHFCIMECSNKHGGEIKPHRTHQNGLSIDFMVPKNKNGERYYDLDNLGAQHYLLQFNDKGQWKEDTTVTIDFEKIAQHLILLDKNARKKGYRISKVILMKELKDELYATTSGKKIKEQNIYITKNLSKLINLLHDDHYHIDFEKI